MSTKRILMSRFGDYQKVEDNTSWQAVKYMDQDHIEKTYDIHLDRRQINMAYKFVDRASIQRLLKMSTKRVLITAFGDFENVARNPSWQGVSTMKQDHIEMTYNIHLDRRKMEVAYKFVERCVPKLWDTYQPDLTIHVGVKDKISCFNLETQARRKSYIYEDIEKYKPEKDGEHFLDGPDTITTDLNVDQICQRFKKMQLNGLKVEKSDDAGKFLCEYIYYTSLVCCGGRGSKTIFVHVPNKGLGKEEIALGLEYILQFCLEQMK